MRPCGTADVSARYMPSTPSGKLTPGIAGNPRQADSRPRACRPKDADSGWQAGPCRWTPTDERQQTRASRDDSREDSASARTRRARWNRPGHAASRRADMRTLSGCFTSLPEVSVHTSAPAVCGSASESVWMILRARAVALAAHQRSVRAAAHRIEQRRIGVREGFAAFLPRAAEFDVLRIQARARNVCVDAVEQNAPLLILVEVVVTECLHRATGLRRAESQRLLHGVAAIYGERVRFAGIVPSFLHSAGTSPDRASRRGRARTPPDLWPYT